MFYDPMIAKLCTWAPDRPAAIAQMRNALDAFEVEGIGITFPSSLLSWIIRSFVLEISPRPLLRRNIQTGFMGSICQKRRSK